MRSLSLGRFLTRLGPCSYSRNTTLQSMGTFVSPLRWQDDLSEEDLRDFLSTPSSSPTEQKKRAVELSEAQRIRGHTKAYLVHAIVDEDMTLEDVLCRDISLPRDVAQSLIRFGAVHWSRIPPEVPSYLAHAETALGIRQRAMEHLLSSGELDTMSQKQRARISKAERIVDGNMLIPALSYVRIHMVPKRFPVFYSVDWTKNVVADGDEYIVMNKPSGLPVPPTVDNIQENLLMGALKAVQGNGKETLFITTRIDQPTEGLVVLGKTPEFISRFNGLILNRSVRKRYRAAVVAPLEKVSSIAGMDCILGDVRHRVQVNFRAPGLPFLTLVTDDNDINSVEAHMSIESARELGAEASQILQETYGISQHERLYELDIDLITGRTHQIRCQLSALGLPIIGDTLYGPLADKRLRKELLENTFPMNLHANGDERILYEPPGPIALQAYKLDFESNHDVFYDRIGESVTFQIDAAWWHHAP